MNISLDENIVELRQDESQNISGGGPAGFVIGSLIGSTVATVGSVILVCGGSDEKTVEAFYLSSFVACAAVGSMFIV